MKTVPAARVATGPRSLRRMAILGLAAAAAAIHFSLLFPDPVFIMNGLGFLVLLAAYLLPVPWLEKRRRLVRLAFIAYTLVTIAAWIAIGDKSMPLGYISKGIEILLIIALLTDRSSGSPTGSARGESDVQ
jgi:hypothetical protein